MEELKELEIVLKDSKEELYNFSQRRKSRHGMGYISEKKARLRARVLIVQNDIIINLLKELGKGKGDEPRKWGER